LTGGSAGGEINASRRACAHINPFGHNPGDRADGWVVDDIGGSASILPNLTITQG